MYLTRTLLFLAVLAVSATAASANDSWRIVQSTGVVKAGGSGFIPAAVRPDQSLPHDSWVETGDTGRVVLVRGAETIALGPNARVQLPSQEVNGNTQVLQTLGSALYQIGKQKKPHFQVDTPYLAAVVKGTTFTVSVGEEASSVDVTEGLVQVASADGSDTEYVSPGFTGMVSKNDRGNVVVVTTEHGNAAPEATPTKSNSSASEDSNGKNRSVIATAIGETTIDVKEVSSGLANGVDNALSNGNGNKVGLTSVSADASESSESHGNSANSNGNAATVASVDVGSTSVSLDVGNGNGNANGIGNGNGNGAGGASLDVDLGGSSGVTVDLDVGGSNGNGNGAGNGLGLGVGNGNSGDNNSGGNGNGLGLGLGNGNGLGLGLGNGNGLGLGKNK